RQLVAGRSFLPSLRANAEADSHIGHIGEQDCRGGAGIVVRSTNHPEPRLSRVSGGTATWGQRVTMIRTRQRPVSRPAPASSTVDTAGQCLPGAKSDQPT